MKTPPSVVAKAVAYWAVLYAVLIVPQFSKNYIVNLLWMTLIAPNAMRFAIGKIPQLAVDRGFFLVSTMFLLGSTTVLLGFSQVPTRFLLCFL